MCLFEGFYSYNLVCVTLPSSIIYCRKKGRILKYRILLSVVEIWGVFFREMSRITVALLGNSTLNHFFKITPILCTNIETLQHESWIDFNIYCTPFLSTLYRCNFKQSMCMDCNSYVMSFNYLGNSTFCMVVSSFSLYSTDNLLIVFGEFLDLKTVWRKMPSVKKDG